MQKPKKKKKPKPRIPVEAVLKLKSFPLETKKGKKGYNRKKSKNQTSKLLKATISHKT